MTTTLKGQTVSQMRQNFKAYSENYRFYANLKPVDLWIEDLYTLGSYRDNEPIKWIKSMLNINPRDRPTAQTLFSIITQQQAGSDTLFSPVMFCGLCCLGGGDSSFGSESDGERWIEEPEEQRTLHQYLSVNLDPALAQADQYSSALERNTHGEQDPSQRSNDALSNNIYPRCHNNNGDRDEDKGGFSSLRNPADHLQSANMDNSIDGMFPSYANTQGKGSPTRGTMERRAQSRHQGQKSNCTFPGCNNNQGKGFASIQIMERHARSRHQGQKSNCSFPGCNNNQGKGFSTPRSVERHIRSKHQALHGDQKSNCTFPGCDNNQGKGFAVSRNMERHARSRHQGQKLSCTFPDCNNNQGKGFHPVAMDRHVRVFHFGQQSRFRSHSSSRSGGEGFADHNSVALSEELGGGMD